MRTEFFQAIEVAPHHWSDPCTHSETPLHQLSPYIGKLKSSIAADLVENYTSPGDSVLDPFCGSGTIPLECALRERLALASDGSPYAITLTNAKLKPPLTLDAALCRLQKRLQAAATRNRPDLRVVPIWVRRFFHPNTLRDAIRFADECLTSRDHFLLACFLGILHHQRPGFLSYPSSHLVPYLRERNFPRDRFPELYEERAIEPRMVGKLNRVYKTGALMPSSAPARVRLSRIEHLHMKTQVDAIITSPPYMNALDYYRDNRLRLWFLDRSVRDYAPEPTDRKMQFDHMVRALGQRAISRLKKGGHCVLVVGETVQRKRITTHPAKRMVDLLAQWCPSLRLKRIVADSIPDVRRSRRGGGATKREMILVFQRSNAH